MELFLNIPFKENDPVYIIERSKIEKYFFKNVCVDIHIQNPDLDFSHAVLINVDRYNNGTDFSETKLLLRDCFQTKEELIKQL
jgi:hypothetical protein